MRQTTRSATAPSAARPHKTAGISIAPPAYQIAIADQETAQADDAPVQCVFGLPTRQSPPAIPNNTGLPDQLKTGIEQLSGYAMDDVQVHYNSPKPATLQAHAYAQGTAIHIAPGQEKHLPHEAWHVVQQKQGRVKPTLQMKGGVNVNDDAGLEKEADVMGGRAVQRNKFSIDLPCKKISKSNSLPGMEMAVQRLALKNTNWGKVNSIGASSAGAGGVLFMNDGNGALVVKPRVEAEDEKIAAYLHSAIGGRIKEGIFDGWQVKGLGVRIADANDVQGIQDARIRITDAGLQGDAEKKNRARGLLDAVAAGTTMIQESASHPSDSLASLMANQADDHIKRSEDRNHGKKNKSKVKDDSPLKLLTKNPSFAIALGRLTAADIVAGNSDRLVSKPNLDNFLINLDDKTIFAIDNMEQGAPMSIVNPNVSLSQWASYPAQAAFIAKEFDKLAYEIWNPSANKEFQGISVAQELAEGTTSQGNQVVPMVGGNQKAFVEEKLSRHIIDIQKNFAKGLEEGHKLILKRGRIQADDPVSKNFNSRISVIERGGV